MGSHVRRRQRPGPHAIRAALIFSPLVSCVWFAPHEFGHSHDDDLRVASHKASNLRGGCSAVPALPLPAAERVCPTELQNFELERAAAARGIGKPAHGKGAIVILAQNHKHVQYGRDSVAGLRLTLERLYKHYNARERDDVIILHEGDFTAADQAKIVADRNEVSFMLLEGENWRDPPPEAGNPGGWKGIESVGYRKMMRWYAVRIWPALAKRGYTWVMRLDDDSILLNNVPYNFFGFMEANHFDYAFRNFAYESGWTGATWYHFLCAYANNKNKHKYGWLTDRCEVPWDPQNPYVDVYTPENCGQALGFYNNFFVANITRFLQPDIQKLLKEIDDTSQIFTYRWNDLIIQSAVVQMFIPKNRVFQFTGWGYAHHSGNPRSLFYGLAQTGHFSKDPCAELQHVVTKVWALDGKKYLSMSHEAVQWRAKRGSAAAEEGNPRGVSFLNVSGLLTVSAPSLLIPAQLPQNKSRNKYNAEMGIADGWKGKKAHEIIMGDQMAWLC